MKYLNSLTTLYEFEQIFVLSKISKYCIGLVDVDKLTEYNFINGYDKGDLQLERLCEILTFTLPKNSVVSRLGSDEFIFLFELDDSNEEIVNAFALNCHARLTVTVSICTIQTNINPLKLIINKLKYLMFQLKQSGGNKTINYDEIRTN